MRLSGAILGGEISFWAGKYVFGFVFRGLIIAFVIPGGTCLSIWHSCVTTSVSGNALVFAFWAPEEFYLWGFVVAQLSSSSSVQE